MTPQPKHPVKVAHVVSGRLRLQLMEPLSEEDRNALITDLRSSPEIKEVKVRGKSIIIEHSSSNEHPWSILERYFPRVTRVSDEIDAAIAKLTETPEVNKLIPLSFLAFGVVRALSSGTLMAGESAFAIIYISFDLYWKFQQENIIRKIHQGLGRQSGAS